MSTVMIDTTRGVDVFRGSKLLAHFDGADCYAQACEYAAKAAGRWIRYWACKAQ